MGSYYLVVLSLVNLLFLPPFLSPCDLPLFGGGRAESIFRLVEPSSGCCTVKCTTTTTRTTCCNGKQTRLRVAKGTSRADGSNSRASVAKQKHKQKQKQKQKHKQAIRQTTKQTICIEDAPLPPFDHFPPSPQPLQIATTTTNTTSTNTKGASGQLVRRNRDRSSFFAEKSTMRIRDEESQKAKQEQIENYELRTENRERKNKKGRTEKS